MYGSECYKRSSELSVEKALVSVVKSKTPTRKISILLQRSGDFLESIFIYYTQLEQVCDKRFDQNNDILRFQVDNNGLKDVTDIDIVGRDESFVIQVRE